MCIKNPREQCRKYSAVEAISCLICVGRRFECHEVEIRLTWARLLSTVVPDRVHAKIIVKHIVTKGIGPNQIVGVAPTLAKFGPQPSSNIS